MRAAMWAVQLGFLMAENLVVSKAGGLVAMLADETADDLAEMWELQMVALLGPLKAEQLVDQWGG